MSLQSTPLTGVSLSLLRRTTHSILLRAHELVAILPVFLIFLPTLIAAAYYGLIAAHQYESEARFIVRAPARTDPTGGVAALFQAQAGKSQDDLFTVNEFLTSRDAVRQLQEILAVQPMYGPQYGDFIAAYPSMLYGSSEEEFYSYFQRMISVIYVSTTGITTLRVRAFRAEDARIVAEQLLLLGERLLNRMNERMLVDAVAMSDGEVRRIQERLIDAQVRVATFRNHELMVDPSRNAVVLSELVGRLSAELSGSKAQVAEMLSSSPQNPQLPSLRRRAQALEEQIQRERERVGSMSDGLADKIADYERLNMRREFELRALAAAEGDLSKARADARRQQLYLERIAQPSEPDYATHPKRVRYVATVFGCNLLLALIGWLILSGIREHKHTGH